MEWIIIGIVVALLVLAVVGIRYRSRRKIPPQWKRQPIAPERDQTQTHPNKNYF